MMIKRQRLVRVGNCDLCGRFSSRLFEGACPCCNERYHPLFASGEPKPEGDPPVGYEAADIQVVRKSA